MTADVLDLIEADLSAAVDRDLRRRARRRRHLRAGAAALVVAAGLASAGLRTAGDGGGLSTASAGTLLRDAADHVDIGELPGRIPEGRAWYQKTIATAKVFHDPSGGSIPPYTSRETTELWIGSDGSTRQRTRREQLFETPADRRRYRASGLSDPDAVGLSDNRYGPEVSQLGGVYMWNFPGEEFSLSYDEMLAVPSDPEALRRRIVAGIDRESLGGSIDRVVWGTAVRLLSAPAVPTPTRVAALRLAASIRGIADPVPARDPLGRDALMVAPTDTGYRTELFVDPRTGDVLATRTRTAAGFGPDSPDSRIVVTSGLVDSFDDRP